MSRAQDTFRRGLGARIDAFEMALRSAREGDAEAAGTIRRLAISLIVPATTLSLPELAEAAKRTKDAPKDELSGRVEALVDRLRDEAARADEQPHAVLVVGGNAEFNASLLERLDTAHVSFATVGTAAEAQHFLQEQTAACIVLNLVLPDMDGRALLTSLREDARTASLPVLILAQGLVDSVKEDSLLHTADAYVEKPQDPDTVAEWIEQRLRRAAEPMRPARRDLLTGLLNRAAFLETFDHTRAECAANGEPMALAAISITGNTRARLTSYESAAREQMLQKVGTELSHSLRTTDVLARWGVYEFAVLFPGEDQIGGTRAVEKVFEKLRDHLLDSPNGPPLKLALSGGVTLVAPELSLDDAMAEVDRHIFEANAAGANRVVSDHSPVSPGRTERVLIVSAEDVTARVLRQLFEKDGAEVVEIVDPKQPIAEVTLDQKFHLILVDDKFPLPGGGYAVVEELRSHPRNNRVPVIMLISDRNEEHIVRALELGANDYVLRPFSPIPFVNRMRRFLARGVAAAEGAASRACRILIVDDNAQRILLTASSLHQHGAFRVLLSIDTEDAVTRLREERPDAVFIDLDIREGKTALAQLTEAATLEDNAIVAAVGDFDEWGDPPRLPSSVTGYIRKPCSPLQLGERIEQILDLPAAGLPQSDDSAQFNDEIRRIMTRG